MLIRTLNSKSIRDDKLEVESKIAFSNMSNMQKEALAFSVSLAETGKSLSEVDRETRQWLDEQYKSMTPDQQRLVRYLKKQAEIDYRNGTPPSKSSLLSLVNKEKQARKPDPKKIPMTFIDSYTGLEFISTLEQVENGERLAEKHYCEDRYLCWCDLFYLIDGNMRPHDSAIGAELGWSIDMFRQFNGENNHEGDELYFYNEPVDEHTFTIEYSYLPEYCFYEY